MPKGGEGGYGGVAVHISGILDLFPELNPPDSVTAV